MEKLNGNIKLEICAGSLEDCILAEKAGADRLELNTGLSLGGLTPSPGLFSTVMESVRIPVIVMIRPRSGGFSYSSYEFRTMMKNVEYYRDNGAAGIATGFLNTDGTLDYYKCLAIRDACKDIDVVFHRAFDFIVNPFEALEQLIELGFTRILTSGAQGTAAEGMARIKELIDRADGRIEILPGSGINSQNVQKLITETGCRQVHASLGSRSSDISINHIDTDIPLKNFLPDDEFKKTDYEKCSEMRRMLDKTFGMV